MLTRPRKWNLIFLSLLQFNSSTQFWSWLCSEQFFNLRQMGILASAVSSIYFWLKKCKAAVNEMTPIKKLVLVVFQSSRGGGGQLDCGVVRLCVCCKIFHHWPLTTVLLPHPAHPPEKIPALHPLVHFFYWMSASHHQWPAGSSALS